MVERVLIRGKMIVDMRRCLKTLSINILILIFMSAGGALVVLLIANRDKNGLDKITLPKIRKDMELSHGRRDRILGWPTTDFKDMNLTPEGYRRISKIYPQTCMIVFGDSFGYGINTSAEKSWVGVLSEKLDCNIHNYSVPGYGLDQIVLRAEMKMPHYKDKDVILTYIDHDLERTEYSMFSLLWGRYDPLSIKPRFTLEGDKLSYREMSAENVFGDVRRYVDKDKAMSSNVLMIVGTKARKAWDSLMSYGTVFFKLSSYLTALRVEYMIEPFSKNTLKAIEGYKIGKALLKRHQRNCEEYRVNCILLRLPTINDIAYPERIRILELDSLANESGLSYVSSYQIAKCMQSTLLEKQYKGSVELSMLKHSLENHYSPEAEMALGSCVNTGIAELPHYEQ